MFNHGKKRKQFLFLILAFFTNNGEWFFMKQCADIIHTP